MKLAYISTFLFFYIHMLYANPTTEKSVRIENNGMNQSHNYRIQISHGTTTDDKAWTETSTKIDGKNYGAIEENGSTLYSLTETVTTEEIIDISHLSEEFLNCSHIYLNPESYEELSNDAVFVPKYNMSFNRSNYLIRDRLLYLCPIFLINHEALLKFIPTFAIVSIVCSGISAFCIILHMIMFAWLRRLRNLPGYILLSLCVALLLAYLCTFIQYVISEQMDCLVIGMFLLFFLLASFFWMNTMSYDVWRSIRMATIKFRRTADSPVMFRFTRYSLYAWGSPLMIIITSIIVHNTSSNVNYQLIFHPSICWFEYKQALTVYFAVPLFTLLGINVFFFISSYKMISGASVNNSDSQNSSHLWQRLFLSLRLCSVMGFMWLFGIIAAVVSKQEWLWYLYAACNALQGVFIFLSFTVNRKTRQLAGK